MKNDYLYEEIRLYINNIIEGNKGKSAYKLPSENKIAKKFKCSRTPVQKVFSDMEKEGLIYRNHGRGTFIKNEGVILHSKNKTEIYYLIVPHFNSTYIRNIINGVLNFFKDKPAEVYIINTNRDIQAEQKALENILSHNYTGIILYPLPIDTYYDTLLSLLENNQKVIIVGEEFKKLKFSSIHCDYYNEIYELTEALIKKGHKHIALICESSHNNEAYLKRIQGYLKCILKDLGNRYIHILEMDIDAFNSKKAEREIEKFYKENQSITAVITLSLAAELVFELSDLLPKPPQISIVGEPENCAFLENKSYILLDQMSEKIGYTAAEQLYRQISQNAPLKEIICENKIIEK